MKRQRRVKDMTSAVQRFRRRVIAMLDARADALYSLRDRSSEEAQAAMRTTSRIREVIAGMR